MEVADIPTDQSDVSADIAVGDVVAEQETVRLQPFVQLIEGFIEIFVCLIVCFR